MILIFLQRVYPNGTSIETIGNNEWGVANGKHFKESGADVTFQAYREGHTVSSENQQDFIKWLLNKEEMLI